MTGSKPPSAQGQRPSDPPAQGFLPRSRSVGSRVPQTLVQGLLRESWGWGKGPRPHEDSLGWGQAASDPK